MTTVGDVVYVAVSPLYAILALNATTGVTLWQTALAANAPYYGQTTVPPAKPFIWNNQLFTALDRVYSIQLTDGAILWQSPAMAFGPLQQETFSAQWLAILPTLGGDRLLYLYTASNFGLYQLVGRGLGGGGWGGHARPCACTGSFN